MKKKLRFIPVIFLLFGFTVLITFNGSKGYNLSVPDTSSVLPESLHEISGLTTIDSVSVACVQDELGIIFIYDAINHKMIKQVEFATPGDYEGIARVGKDLYVLRSDGSLAEVLNFNTPKMAINYFTTGIPVKNNEGLCYDVSGNRLLIGCKSKPEGPEHRDSRLIFSFDLKTKQLVKTPTYNFSVREIIQYASEKNVSLPLKVRKKGKATVKEPFLRLGTSEIAIHPITKELYLLSAVDKLLIVFNRAGKPVHIEALDPIIFNKAEGITFFSNGDMLITNEGQERRPTLHRFNYKNHQ